MRSETGGAPMEPRAVAEWKFRELDRDRSGTLQKSEYRGLRRLIKKVYKPYLESPSYVDYHTHFTISLMISLIYH